MTARRALAIALSAALALVVMSGCSSGADDSPAAASAPAEATAPASPTAPARQGASTPSSVTVSVADPASPAALAVATREASKSDLAIVPGSVVRVVRAQEATGGYVLWSFQANQLTLCMILDPSGKGVAWSGTAQRFDGLDRCAGAVARPSTLVLAGRAGPDARAVRIVTRAGEHRAAALGVGGWLYFDGDLPIEDEHNGRIPAAVQALDGSGKVIAEERFPR